MTGTRQKPAPPSRKKTPAALLSLLTSKLDTANDHTANDHTANDHRNQAEARAPISKEDTRRPSLSADIETRHRQR